MTQQSEVSSSHAATVSVVVPTFNHAKFLNQALQSIIKQSHQNWEAIIVNNFSTDDTLQIIESFNEPRFKVVNFQNNGIIAASRNEGIRRSSAQLILDAKGMEIHQVSIVKNETKNALKYKYDGKKNCLGW